MTEAELRALPLADQFAIFRERASSRGEGFGVTVRDLDGAPRPIDEAERIAAIPARTVPTSDGPGLIAKAASLATAVVKHVADGARKASPEAQADRKAICISCPMLDAARDRCNSCGCRLDLKRSWASESCPDGKWGVEP
jgi:hypothetical protein